MDEYSVEIHIGKKDEFSKNTSSIMSDNYTNIEDIIPGTEKNYDRSDYTSDIPQSEINIDELVQKSGYKLRADALADFEKNENKKWFFNDSKLMKNIKEAALEVESIIDMSVSLDDESIKRSLGELDYAYDKLIMFCTEYENTNRKKENKKDTAGNRFRLVREIKNVSMLERKNLSLAVNTYKSIYKNTETLPNWQDILRIARADIKLVDEDKYTMSQVLGDNLEGFDAMVAASRLADYLGISNVVLDRKYVNKEEALFFRYVNKDEDDGYVDQGSFNDRINQNNAADRVEYTESALKKMQSIRVMEALLGVSFNDNDIKFKYNEDDDNTEKIIVEDVVVNLSSSDYAIGKMTRFEENSGVVIDRTLANSIMAIDEDIIGRLFADVMNGEQKKILAKNIKKMKARFDKKDTRILEGEEWVSEASRIITEQKASNQGVSIEKVNISGFDSRNRGLSDKDRQTIMSEYEARELASIESANHSVNPVEREKLENINAEYISLTTEIDGKNLTFAKLSYELDHGKTKYVKKITNENPNGDKYIFDHIPNAGDIVQGAVGNRKLLSVLATIVAKDPEYIMNMFENKGQYVLVKFPKKTVAVSKNVVMIEKAGKKEKYYSKGAYWVSLFEKAYAALCDGVPTKRTEDLCKMYYKKKYGEFDAFNLEFSLDDELDDCVERTAGGDVDTIFKNITGKKYSTVELDIITAGTMKKAYSNMWKLAKAGDPDHEEFGAFSRIEKFLQTKLKDSLEKEIKRRYARTYENSSGGTSKSYYRSVTIEGIKEILLDIKNWTFEAEDTNYRKLYMEVKNEIYKPKKGTPIELGEPYSEKVFMGLITKLANKLENAGCRDDNGFEHDSHIKTRMYTRRAQHIGDFLKAAVKKGTVTAKAKNFIEKPGRGINANKLSEGIIGGNTYIITGYNEGDLLDRHATVTLLNPAGIDVPKVYKVTNEVTKKEQMMNVSGTDKSGSFNMDLNDFIRFFGEITLPKEVLKADDVKTYYNRFK